MSDSPYEVLGIPKDSDLDAIDAAYRRKARKSHPDRDGDKEEFVRVKNAVALLRDSVRRKRFDETGDATEPGLNKWREVVVTMFVSTVQEMVNTNGDPGSLAVDKAMMKRIADELKGAKHCLSKIEGIASRLTEPQKVIADAIRHNLKEVRDRIAVLEQAYDYLKSCKYKLDEKDQTGFIYLNVGVMP